MTTLFTHATIFQGAGSPLLNDSYLLVSDGLITDIGPMTSRPAVSEARIIDCDEKLLMPGLINSHNHCAMTLFRGMADDLELSQWLQDHIFPAEKAYASPEMTYWCTRLAAAEMLLSGTTCVGDAYFFSDQSASALRDCGIRAVVGHGILDFPAPSVPDPKKNIETVSRFLDRWLDADPLIIPAVFAHAPYTCSPETLVKAKTLADDKGVRFFTHLAETEAEASMVIDPQGDTPLRHLEALGLLDSNTICVHAVWLDDSDIEILARRGGHVVSCPQSNLKLASGIAPISQMLQHGLTVGLGTDGCASNNSLDMFREMSTFAKIHKLYQLDPTAITAKQTIAAATSENSKLLGLSQLGTLAPGNRADIICLDVHRPHLTPLYSPDLLVYSATGSDVHSTMVNGQMLVENGKIVAFDLEETVAKVRELAEQIP